MIKIIKNLFSGASSEKSWSRSPKARTILGNLNEPRTSLFSAGFLASAGISSIILLTGVVVVIKGLKFAASILSGSQTGKGDELASTVRRRLARDPHNAVDQMATKTGVDFSTRDSRTTHNGSVLSSPAGMFTSATAAVATGGTY